MNNSIGQWVIAALLLVGIFSVERIYSKEQESVPITKKSAHIRNREYRLELFESFSPQAEVVFVGDSITRNAEWHDFFPERSVLNRGVGSDKTADVLRRLDSILQVDPKIVFVMLGINDIYSRVPLERVISNYTQIVAQLRAEGIHVVVQSTIQCRYAKCGAERIELVNSLNEALRSVAQQQGADFLSLGDLSTDSGLALRYTYDGIHLTAEGYQLWVSKIDDYLGATGTQGQGFGP